MALAKSLTTTWHVPADKPYVGFPLCPGTYFNSDNLDIKIDWGDGQADEITDSAASAARTVLHKYDAAGDKVITVYGGYGTNDNNRKIAFPSFDDRAVIEFGPSRSPSTMERLKGVTTWEKFYIHGQGDFKGCTMLTTVPWNFSNFLKSTDPATAISFSSTGTFLMNSTFEGCASFDSWIGWNVSDCTSMNSTFKNTTWTTTKQNCLGDWDVSNVTDMTSLFEGSNYTDQYISKWKGKVNKVKSMAKMFRNCAYIGGTTNNRIDKWFKPQFNPTPATVNMSGMFSGSECKFGTNYNIAKGLWQWNNLTWVEDVSDMFRDNPHCDIWLDVWFMKKPGVTYAVKNMSGMFANSAMFKKTWNRYLHLWDMRSVENVSEMFKDNENVEFTPAGKSLDAWFKKESNVTYSVKDMSGMFAGACKYGNKAAMKGINEWDMSTVENISEMFKGNQYFDYDLSKWFEDDGTNYVVTDMSGLFEGSVYGKAVETHGSQNLNKWGYSYKITDIQDWDMSSVESTARMFKDNQYYNGELNKLLDDSPTGGVSIKNISGMFENSIFDNWYTKPSGGSTNVLPWKLNTCEDISRCFAGTAAYTGNLGSWFNNTSKSGNLKDISSLLEGNTTYNTRGLRAWKLPVVENASGMFKNSAYTETLWGLELPAATDTSSMFEGSQYNNSLETLSLKSVIDASYMFRNSAYDKKSGHFFPAGSKVKYMAGMFSGENCQFGAAENPKISGWKTDTVVDMSEMFKENEHYDYWLGPVNGFGWNVSNVRRHYDFKTKADWTSIPNFKDTTFIYFPNPSFGSFDLTEMVTLSGRVVISGTGVLDELTLQPSVGIPGAVEILDPPDKGNVSLEVTSKDTIEWIYRTPSYTEPRPYDDSFVITYTDSNTTQHAIPVEMTVWWPVTYSDPEAGISIDTAGWNLYNTPEGIQIGRNTANNMTVTNNKATLESEGLDFSETFEWYIGTKHGNDYTWTSLDQPEYADSITLYPGSTYTGDGHYLNCVYKVFGADGKVATAEFAEPKPSLDYATYTEAVVTSVAIDSFPDDGLPTGENVTLSVGAIVSNKGHLVSEGQTVSDVYKWYINGVEVGDQQTLTITGDGNGPTGVSHGDNIALYYKLVSPVPGINNNNQVSHTIHVEPTLSITSVTLSANHATFQGDDTVTSGDTYTVNAVVDTNGSVGHADPSKPVNADSETYLWESNPTGGQWIPAAGVNDQSSYSFVADDSGNGNSPGVLRVTYTITNESDTASLTSSVGGNIVIVGQPSPYDYTVELEDVGTPGNPEYVVKVGAGQYPNPQSTWDETDTMYAAINPGGANNPSAPVTKTIDLRQPASLGKSLGLTTTPRGFNNDYANIEEYEYNPGTGSTAVTIVDDILTVEIDPQYTPSLWLYDKAPITELKDSDDRGIKGKYFYHVPFEDSNGDSTHGEPSVSITASDTGGTYDDEVDITVSATVNGAYWIDNVSIAGNATTLAGMSLQSSTASPWKKNPSGTGSHIMSWIYKYTPDANDGPSQNFEFIVSLDTGDGESNLTKTVSNTLGDKQIQPGDGWVWNTFATGTGDSDDYIHLYLRSLPDDTLPNWGGLPSSNEYTPEAIKTYLNGSIPAINNPSFNQSTDLNPFGTWELADHDISVPLIPDNSGNLSTVTVPAGKWYYRKGHDGSLLGNKHLAIFQYPQDSTGQWKPGTGGYRAFSMWEINPDTSTYYNMLEFGPELGGQGNYTGHSITEANNLMLGSYGGQGWTPPTIPSGIQAGWKYVITTPDPIDPTDYNKALYGSWAAGKYEGCITAGNVNHDPLADYQSSTLACIPEVLGCTDPLADNYNAAANTDDGTCTYSNAWGSLPTTVNMTWAEAFAGNFGYASMPLTFTKNGNQNNTHEFKHSDGSTNFTTNLFYTTSFNIYGSQYVAYLAFSDQFDDGSGTLIESWHAGDDGASYSTYDPAGDIYPDFSTNGYGMYISENRRDRLSPAGDYDGDPTSPYHQATVS